MESKTAMKKWILISVMLPLAFLLINCQWIKKQSSELSPDTSLPWVAHAGGAYKDRTYLNCLECFEESYRKGHRLFEFDLMMTSDGFVVAIHDGQEKDYGLPLPPEKFTLEQYKNSRFADTQRLPESEFVRLMKDYRDWFLITDIKDNNIRALQRIVTF